MGGWVGADALSRWAAACWSGRLQHHVWAADSPPTRTHRTVPPLVGGMSRIDSWMTAAHRSGQGACFRCFQNTQ